MPIYFWPSIYYNEGYRLDHLRKKVPLTEKVDVDELAKGYLWSGVKKYLLEERRHESSWITERKYIVNHQIELTQTQNMSKRQQISVLNAAFCILVVFIHISSEAIVSTDKTSWKYLLLYAPWTMSSFAMQGFIFLSGIKMFLKYGTRPFVYSEFVADRLKRIFVPYLIWVVIYYVYFCYKGFYSFDIAQLLRFVCVGDVVSPFYFIIVILQFYLLMPVWRKAVPLFPPRFALPAALLITILIRHGIAFEYSDRIFTTYLIYWTVGCYIGANYSKFVDLLKKNRIWVYLIVIISGSIDLYFRVSSTGYLLEDIHLLYCVAMILCLFQIAGTIKRPIIMKGIEKINGVSLGIFFSHCLFIYIINFCMNDMGITKISVRFFLRAAFVYSASYFVCFFYHKIKWKVSSRNIRRDT